MRAISVSCALAAASLLGCSLDVSGTGRARGSAEDPTLPEPGGDAALRDGALDAAGSRDGGPSAHDSDVDPADGGVDGPDADAPLDARVPDGPDAMPPDGGAPDVEVPVTAPVYAGDYPDDPYGEAYEPLPGFSGPGGAPRGYKLHVPPGFVQGTPAPVLFAFHGEFQTGALFSTYGADLLTLSDDLGVVLVVPNGVRSGPDAGSWNGGACCGTAATSNVDDMAFVRGVLAHLRTRLRIDARRTYALGFSGGGFLAYRAACELSDVFAAVAVVGGGLGTPELGAVSPPANRGFPLCTPTRPVSVLHVHGADDAYVPYAALGNATRFWAGANGCGNVSSAAPRPVPTGASRCVAFTGCPASVSVTACTVAAGGHCWFGSGSCGTGGPPNPTGNIGPNSDDLDVSAAIQDFLAHLPPR